MLTAAQNVCNTQTSLRDTGCVPKFDIAAGQAVQQDNQQVAVWNRSWGWPCTVSGLTHTFPDISPYGYTVYDTICVIKKHTHKK